jgi:glucose 1-dehydrogenase
LIVRLRPLPRSEEHRDGMTYLGMDKQTALVTGASSGIGRAIARELARHGCAVGVNYHSDEAGALALVREIEDFGGRAVPLKGDVSRERDCLALVDAVASRFGRIDILVANSGIQRDAPFTQLSLADWQKVLDVNLTGHFLCAQEAVRHFRRQQPLPDVRARGNIIFMNSVHQVIPWAGHINYAASKGGLMLLMESLAQEVAHEKIRVNAIAPGAIRTAINEPVWSDAASAQSLVEMIPYGRIGDPEDVARAAAWLASDQADYVVGTTLFVDGGMTLYPSFREGG